MGMKVNGTSGLTFPDTTTLASAGQASVRAWVNFNGTGTVAIRASYNVASITDGGTGIYRVNFTTAMPDANYAAVGSTQGENVSILPLLSANQGNDQTTTYVDVYTTGGSTGAPFDFSYVGVSVFR
jgi:hypothetical protein